MSTLLLAAALTSGAVTAGPNPAANALRAAFDQGLHESRMWQLLLHYELLAAGGVESRADGESFFLHADGKRDAAGELRATLEAFFVPPKDSDAATDDQHALCRFPARRAYLESALADTAAFVDLPRPRCRAYHDWMHQLDAGRVTVVFADAYLSSPPSMFGHTLLRIDRRDALDDLLLSTVINYAAASNTGSFPLYALRGMTGGVRGFFSVAPYYVKVQEYSNLEARDMWEYQLDLTPEQIETLLAHTWELSQTYFEYYFLTENCSFHLLSLIEVARPDLRLSERFRLLTLPADTIRSFAGHPGLVAKRVHRPSQTKVMNALRGLLSAEEIALVEHLVNATNPRLAPQLDQLADYPPARQALILDAAHDYLARQSGFRDNSAFQRGIPGRFEHPS